VFRTVQNMFGVRWTSSRLFSLGSIESIKSYFRRKLSTNLNQQELILSVQRELDNLITQVWLKNKDSF